jgi:hypothetical protein
MEVISSRFTDALHGAVSLQIILLARHTNVFCIRASDDFLSHAFLCCFYELSHFVEQDQAPWCFCHLPIGFLIP